MFNALNRFMSRLDGGDTSHSQQDRGSFGFQVLRNTDLQLAIEPWFDYVVGINGRPIVILATPARTTDADALSRTTQTQACLLKKYEIALAAAFH
ncbi:hypothetical protein CRV24_001110 [Beauveria bassiana]|uniref:Uncharacterized protein n=1 Tax=Beauveria bassiana TaxID=176275 RepID=A0A2N6P060_BEABA|nr:hypothetical protein CRV24_001110 [Beauveria bassiana]PMB72890.1 hypothetical protein BM221_000307 [Beauveria bassiana]